MSTAVLSTPSPNSKIFVGNSLSSYHTPMSYKCQNLSNSMLFTTPPGSFKTSTPITTRSSNNTSSMCVSTTSTSKYVNLGTIGEGSYGLVLKCKDRETGRLVAIKKFIESEDDKSVRKIAMREIHLLKQLRHENLVNLLEVFRRKRRLYLVFEFVDRSLLDHLELSPHGLEKGQIRRILFQVIRALEFCHIHNIIHRDVKPENILISKNGVVKLCDFGFARTLAKPGEIYTEYVSTRWYRAPELLVGDSRYGRAVDIWALGCLNAEMLTGQPLFPGDSDIDQLFSIVKCFGGLCRRHEDKLYSNPSFRFEISQIEVTEPLKCRLRGCTARDFQFVAMCLELDPQDRPTCSSLLQHPLFTCDGFSSWFPEELREMIRNDEEGDKHQLAKPRRLLPDVRKCLELSKNGDSSPTGVQVHHNGSTISLDMSLEKSITNLKLTNSNTSTSKINSVNNQRSSNLSNTSYHSNNNNSFYKSTTNSNLNAKELVKGLTCTDSKSKHSPLTLKHSSLNDISINSSGFDFSINSTCTSIVEGSPQVPVAKKMDNKMFKVNNGVIKNSVKGVVQPSLPSSSSSSNSSSADASTSSMTSSSASSCYAKNENFVGKNPASFDIKSSSNNLTNTGTNSSSLKKTSKPIKEKNYNCQNSVPTSKSVQSLQPKNILLPSQQRMPQQRSGESPKDSRKPVGTTPTPQHEKQQKLQQNIQPKMKKSQGNNIEQQRVSVVKPNVAPKQPQYGYPKPIGCNKNFMTAVKFST